MSESITPSPTNTRLDATLMASVHQAVAEFYDQCPEPLRSKRQSEALRDQTTEREAAFINKVFNATVELASQHSGPLTLLFDVDETLLKTRSDRHHRATNFVRPALPILLTMLDEALGERYDIGLLTSRGQSHLAEELDSPTYTQAIGERLNPDFVISSRSNSPIYAHERLAGVTSTLEYGTEAFALKAIRNIINPALIPPIEEDDRSSIARTVEYAHWYDGKLAILSLLSDEYPDRAFVFVDDLPFPATIDPSHRQVRGVALGDTASFRL